MQKRFLFILVLTGCCSVVDLPASFEAPMYEQSHCCAICGSYIIDGSDMVPLFCEHKVCKSCFQRGFDAGLVCSLCAKRSRSEDELAALDKSQATPGRWKRFVGGTVVFFVLTLSTWTWSKRGHDLT